MGGTVVRAQARRRWATVLAVVVVLLAVPIGISAWPAGAAAVDAGALRDRIAASARQPYEGFALSSGLLPLPSLPNLEQVTALVTGTTQMRTWYAARDRWRVDVIGEAGSERDLYQTPEAQYVWDYGANQLSRIAGDQPVRLPRAADLTPPELVRWLLGVAAGDRFEPLAGRRVAGIDAAGMRVVPAAAGTTVAFADVWADPATGLPVQAEITAKGGTRPVFTTRFLELHLKTPAADVLTPPTPGLWMGFTETEAPDVLGTFNRFSFGPLPDHLAGYARRDTVDATLAAGAYGAGLAQFVVLAVPRRFGSAAYDNAARYGSLLTLPNRRGALLTTGLVNLLVVQGERTYLVAGLVDAPVLKRVAADLAGAAL
jgi:hypothetical protein